MPSAQASDRQGAAQPARSAVWPERGPRKSRSHPKCRASRAAARAVPTVALGYTQAPQWQEPARRKTSTGAGSRPRKGFRQSTKKAASIEVAYSIRYDRVRSCSILFSTGRRPVVLCYCLSAALLGQSLALRLISAHLRPEESGGKPKVTHLRGQRSVVATHDAVALREGRLTVARRHSFGFIIH